MTAWNTFAANLVAENLPPGPQTHTLAIVHIAIHDALNAIDPRYERYEFVGSAPAASVAAAVAAAAHDTLIQLVPQAATSVDAQYTASLAAVPGRGSQEHGHRDWPGRRRRDSLPAECRRPSRGDHETIHAWPCQSGRLPTNSASQRRPPGGVERTAAVCTRDGEPVSTAIASSVESITYATEYNEVRRKGSRDSMWRTARQTETALFWYTAATREWNVAAQKGLADARADEWRAARTLAVLNIALADAVIATFDAKFEFNYWRPITAIRAGDTDGNAATNGDPGWEPLCETPPFPEYNSTHAATAAAAAGVLMLELGDRHSFTITSPTGASRRYNRFSAAAHEEGVSRIYCGIHFRTAMKMGFWQGGRIARYVDDNLLRPLSD